MGINDLSLDEKSQPSDAEEVRQDEVAFWNDDDKPYQQHNIVDMREDVTAPTSSPALSFENNAEEEQRELELQPLSFFCCVYWNEWIVRC